MGHSPHFKFAAVKQLGTMLDEHALVKKHLPRRKSVFDAPYDVRRTSPSEHKSQSGIVYYFFYTTRFETLAVPFVEIAVP